MALVFVDGFDAYSASLATARGYNTAFASMQSGRLAAQAARISTSGAGGSTSTVLRTLPSTYTTLIVGCAFKTANFAGRALNDFFQFRSGSTAVIRLGVDASSHLVVRTSGGTTIATGTSPIVDGNWYYVEIKGIINGASGSVEVRLNGVAEISTTTGNFGSAAIDGFALTIGIPAGTGTIDFDDLYVIDTSGSSNNSFLGDIRIDTILPTSDGTSTQWTPNGGSGHFDRVDDNSGTFPDGDTTYVSDSTSGHVDEYNFASIPAGSTPLGMVVSVYARKDDAGALQIAPVVRQGGSDHAGTSVALGTGYAYYSQTYDKDTAGSDWTTSTIPGGVSGVQVGVKVV